jgi:Domain of unknown function (DUF4020)/SIR2-like domain
MRIREIDFPKPLLDAQRVGSLVIFAGAGVSIPPPSNYPNFGNLADQVAPGVLTREQHEPVDRFLGRLAHRKVDVHARVQALLSDPASAPNALHFDLLRVFGSAAKVRLVTTNFDLHFSTATKDIYPREPLDTYSAPALPVGDDFTGLVYLHGSVDKPPHRLILIDSDFGRAYLTEGWARRFLQRLFNRYVVLFIGYSYSDTVMTYLTRGLPPNPTELNRYALAKAGQAEYWNYLGITPLEYELVETAENKHIHLAEAVSQWAKIANTGVLEREAEVKRIVEGPVPLGTEEQDYIESSLAEPSTARFFTRYATRLDWLHWIEDKTAFTRLFRTDAVPTDTDWELARWFARGFACKHPEDALALVRRKRQAITPILWAAIAQAFHTEKPAPEVVRKWVPLLIKYPTPTFGGDLLEYTLHRSKYPDDLNSALLLFEYLTRPEIILRERWWPKTEGEADEQVDVELTTEGDDPWLPGVWLSLFKPNLATVANKLIWIVTSHLQRAYLLLAAYEKIHPAWDPLSARRGLIESTAQGTPAKGVGILIDVAREILEWSLSGYHRTADQLIDLWFSSDCRILKRLAIFGTAKATHWPPDAKLKWILENDLLYAPGFKHEVFSVLEAAYAQASADRRTEVLDRARGGPPIAGDHPETQAYEEYNLISWLAKNAPTCPLTHARLTAIREKHPEFAPGEHPDMDAWIGTVTTGWRSPRGFQEILSKTPEEQLDFIVDFEPKDFFREPSREGLLQELSTAFAHDFEWGMRFARALSARQLWKPDVWNAVVEGWKASVTGSQWPTILHFLLSKEHVLGPTMHAVARLLDDGVEKPDRAIPDDSVAEAVALARKTWDACVKDEQGKQGEAKDWLFVALNRAAGTLALFFLRILSKTRKAVGTEWKGLPPEYREIFGSIIGGNTYAAELGRVMLASQVLFLFGLDDKWTVENVVPLFNWSSDSRRALQAWDGYLGWGQWSNALLVHMIENYEETFPVLHAEFGELRTRLCEHLAGIAVLSSMDPLEQGWLNRFLLRVDSEEREMWASSVAVVLQGTTEASKVVVWNSWMSKYWHNRMQGLPVPLSAEEAGRMTRWAIHLEPVFPEVVDAACDSPAPELKFNHIYYELARSPVPNQHPAASAKFVLFLLRNQTDQFWACDDVETIVNNILSTKPSDKRDLFLICDELARLGCGNGASLKRVIQSA